MKNTTIEASIKNKFQQKINKRINEENNKKDFSFNKSLGVYFRNRNNDTSNILYKSLNINNNLNQTVGGSRNKNSYVKTIINDNNRTISGSIKRYSLHLSKMPKKENLFSSDINPINKLNKNSNELDEYKGLSYNNSNNIINNNNIQRKQSNPTRFNSFNSEIININRKSSFSDNKNINSTFSDKKNINKKSSFSDNKNINKTSTFSEKKYINKTSSFSYNKNKNINKPKNDPSCRTLSFEITLDNKQKDIKKLSTFKTNKVNNNLSNNDKISKNNEHYKAKERKNFNVFSNHEKTLSNKKLKIQENEKNEEDDEWNIEQYKGLRKNTIEIKRIKKNANKNKINEINSQFSTNMYIKTSKALSVAGKKEGGIKKTNQDSYILEKNINEVLNYNLFGVLDGHGVNGHLVSKFVSKYIINRLKYHPLLKNLKIPQEIYNKLKLNGYEIIANIFTEADYQLSKQSFNCDDSGTTCVIVIQLEEHIICANAGDSRAIIIFDETNNKNLLNTKIYPLSYDCKPENPNEKKRIYEHGGTVEQIVDEDGIGVGPFRVWVNGEDFPGLAMSRSIGDFEAKNIGVIPNPQIIEYDINYKSKYMIICSDGIWEFIDNEEAMEIGKKYYLRNDPNGLCNELIKKATEIWIKEDTVIDDITVVVAYF